MYMVQGKGIHQIALKKACDEFIIIENLANEEIAEILTEKEDISDEIKKKEESALIQNDICEKEDKVIEKQSEVSETKDESDESKDENDESKEDDELQQIHELLKKHRIIIKTMMVLLTLVQQEHLLREPNRILMFVHMDA